MQATNNREEEEKEKKEEEEPTSTKTKEEEEKPTTRPPLLETVAYLRQEGNSLESLKKRYQVKANQSKKHPSLYLLKYDQVNR